MSQRLNPTMMQAVCHDCTNIVNEIKMCCYGHFTSCAQFLSDVCRGGHRCPWWGTQRVPGEQCRWSNSSVAKARKGAAVKSSFPTTRALVSGRPACGSFPLPWPSDRIWPGGGDARFTLSTEAVGEPKGARSMAGPEARAARGCPAPPAPPGHPWMCRGFG